MKELKEIFSKEEWQAVMQMSKEMDMPPLGVIRQAIRLLQLSRSRDYNLKKADKTHPFTPTIGI